MFNFDFSWTKQVNFVKKYVKRLNQKYQILCVL